MNTIPATPAIPNPGKTNASTNKNKIPNKITNKSFIVANSAI